MRAYTLVGTTPKTIAASASWATAPTNLANFDPAGSLSFECAFTGTGTIKIQVKCSSRKKEGTTTFSIPITSGQIASGLTVGTYFDGFVMPVCESFQLLITETGGENPVVITDLRVVTQ